MIMNNLMEILTSFKEIGKHGDGKNLNRFVLMLSKFNDGIPLDKEIILRIEDFFDFYWENDILRALKSESDKKFMSELPDQVMQ
jgi:hypothetical protein